MLEQCSVSQNTNKNLIAGLCADNIMHFMSDPHDPCEHARQMEVLLGTTPWHRSPDDASDNRPRAHPAAHLHRQSLGCLEARHTVYHIQAKLGHLGNSLVHSAGCRSAADYHCNQGD